VGTRVTEIDIILAAHATTKMPCRGIKRHKASRRQEQPSTCRYHSDSHDDDDDDDDDDAKCFVRAASRRAIAISAASVASAVIV